MPNNNNDNNTNYTRISGEELKERGGKIVISTGEPTTFEEAVDTFVERLRSVLLERQYQHGATSINELGLYGVYWMTRLKVARMKAKFDPVSETVIEGRDPLDDFLDLAGYGCIGWLKLTGLWGLPLAEDTEDEDDEPFYIPREH